MAPLLRLIIRLFFNPEERREGCLTGLILLVIFFIVIFLSIK